MGQAKGTFAEWTERVEEWGGGGREELTEMLASDAAVVLANSQ